MNTQHQSQKVQNTAGKSGEWGFWTPKRFCMPLGNGGNKLVCICTEGQCPQHMLYDINNDTCRSTTHQLQPVVRNYSPDLSNMGLGRLIEGINKATQSSLPTCVCGGERKVGKFPGIGVLIPWKYIWPYILILCHTVLKWCSCLKSQDRHLKSP